MIRSAFTRASRRTVVALSALALTLVLGLGVRASAAEPYDDAIGALAGGDHQAAVAAFERALDQRGWSANALLGLANAYASTGEQGRAILALERARLLAPRDEAIARNLARLREQVAVAAPRESRVGRTLAMLPSNTWSWIALGGASLACAGIVLVAWSRRRRRMGATTAIAGAAIAATAMCAALHAAPDPALAIVVQGEVARIAPLDTADAAFTATPGSRVTVEQRRGDRVYVRVDAAPDRAGWLPRRAVEHIVPTDRRISRS